MPVVQILQGIRTEEQKKEIAQRITQVFVDVLGLPKEDVQVWIQETLPENYSKGGIMMADK